jgi:hypothetical protein
MRPLALLLALGCTSTTTPTPEGVIPAAPVSRAEFNTAVRHLHLPVFWRHDDTIVSYESTSNWQGGGDQAKAAVAAYLQDPPDLSRLDRAEQHRRALVKQELDAGRTTLLETDLSSASEATRKFVGHMLEAAHIIERLYAHQTGASALDGRIPADDPASRALFERNQGPWCASARMTDPACSAIPGETPRPWGLYPSALHQEAGFCARLTAEHPDLLSPFTVLREQEGKLITVPYTQVWSEEMSAVASALRAAADAIEPENEAALATYLRAAAQAFTDNDWFTADAAWAAMNQENSRWYVRVAPDETYFEPCSEHAAFALVLAQVDPSGVTWQQRLEPVKQDMEVALAALAGPPYAVREVGFDLPEFIRITLNAGDARNPLGATIGQSLPNWGPVSESGGRTVAMTNLFTDPDSLAAADATVRSLFCADTAPQFITSDPEPMLATTVLHEAAHNLGPSGEYKVDGQTDGERFGGPMASMLEELKAQTSALYLTGWLVERGVLDKPFGQRMHAADVLWALGKVADGMFNPDGTWKAYGHLAMIQMGFLIEHGALTWRPEELPADGSEPGCFALQADAMPAAIDALAHEVLRIKGSGDAAGAQALHDKYIADEARWGELRKAIAARYQRQPVASFVYRIVR